ncbi:hypothetical protein ACJJTC_013770 [Scirpophaga incertulas]
MQKILTACIDCLSKTNLGKTPGIDLTNVKMSNYKQIGKGAESRTPHHPPTEKERAYKSRTSLNRTWRPDRVVVFEVGAKKETGVVAVGGSAGMQTDCGTLVVSLQSSSR